MTVTALSQYPTCPREKQRWLYGFKVNIPLSIIYRWVTIKGNATAFFKKTFSPLVFSAQWQVSKPSSGVCLNGSTCDSDLRPQPSSWPELDTCLIKPFSEPSSTVWKRLHSMYSIKQSNYRSCAFNTFFFFVVAKLQEEWIYLKNRNVTIKL